MKNNTLDQWLKIRQSINWNELSQFKGPLIARRDGHRHFIATTLKQRDPVRSERLDLALTQARGEAMQRHLLNFDRLCSWQKTVLNVELIGFRSASAFAKGGRECYGLNDQSAELFRSCLLDANVEVLPVLSRAARIYFDVCFFHPFFDGNARAATLALAFVLAREDIVLDEVGPLFMVNRFADRDGALAYVKLLEILFKATENKMLNAKNVRLMNQGEHALSLNCYRLIESS